MNRTILQTCRVLSLLLGLAALPGGALAREPGAAPQFPPGLTLGVPVGLPVGPPGFALAARTSYYSTELKDDNGHSLGQTVGVISGSLQLFYTPPGTILGAEYKFWAAIALVWIEQKNETTQTGPDLGTFNKAGIGDPAVTPLDLSWALGGGFHLSTSFTLYLPIGTYNKRERINPGDNFWTFEPAVGLTYMNAGWHASLHLVYDTNTENTAIKYRSGDQLFWNATFTKDLAGWTIGPVAYGERQTTNDENNGGLVTFGGTVFEKTEQIAVGGLVGHALGRADVTACVTRDVQARNVIAGTKFGINALMRF